MNIFKSREEIRSERICKLFSEIYGDDKKIVEQQQNRYIKAIEAFSEYFPNRDDIKIYSASGRTEIGGNHTDHQRGRILAGAVNLDSVAIVSFHKDGVARVISEGYSPAEISLNDLVPNKTDDGTQAIVRGIVSKFNENGVKVEGFDMYTISDVICGGGISSSAAFETLVGTVINNYYYESKCTPFEIAQIGWFAENKFFGKKCGLLDQSVSSFGGLVAIDFADSQNPQIEKIDYNFEKVGYALCITDTKSSHQNLTDDYDAIHDEMKQVAAHFGKEVLSEVDDAEFYNNISNARKVCSDRAILRAMHFLNETRRAKEEAEALKRNDINEFLRLVNESGDSSGSLLQNLYSVKSPTEQAIPLAIALSKSVLKGEGAVRVHGGGFAGTIQAFVPLEKVDEYKTKIENVFGENSCYQMKIRPVGGIEVL